ncbi:ethanolamine ammonia-lyase subunit EutC [Pseudobacillus wudalianchiensis]|uniref:Ethanolamine ammonia-lyase small subunit n=1 Tax=Pseudobacillus wudalianchiensis TaxID=1743143 RepID=A0A1B9B6V1_9BACI|nr:ethanolamine ammonia-lyase subunit EutC [Bacillus wudalianchiensis]OCA91824.1 ethanolamine ammonia-lyase [Bacillus wudalianchiensis]
MEKELIASITKLVIEKLNQEQPPKEPEVALWSASPKNPAPVEATEQNLERIELKPVRQEAIQRKEQKTHQSRTCSDSLKLEKKEQQLEELRQKTPSRIAVGRAGSRPKTNTWLQFRYDHAAAVDAVYGEVSADVLENLGVFTVHTRVEDKEEYIRRPDRGRQLSDESRKIIKDRCQNSPTVQVVISNGLSAKAVEANIEDVYLSLQQSLNNLKIDMGTTFYVDKGRVALMDEIGEILTPDVVIMLIGERPGLVSAESLSAYMCYKPRKGVIEADRMVVSNIHKGGIPPVEAGAYLGTIVQKILKYQASGVSLVQKES